MTDAKVKGHTLEELLAIAKAATPGPWFAGTVQTDEFGCHDITIGPFKAHKATGNHYEDSLMTVHGENHAAFKETARFIAAFNPTTVLDLLSKVAALSDAVKALEDILRAVDTGNLELNSPEIGGHDHIPPHPWHEEWLYRARAIISTIKDQNNAG